MFKTWCFYWYDVGQAMQKWINPKKKFTRTTYFLDSFLKVFFCESQIWTKDLINAIKQKKKEKNDFSSFVFEIKKIKSIIVMK